MPNRYTPTQKQEALELLELHNHNVPIVHQLTGIPRSTLYYWRDQELSNKNVSIGQKNIPSPIGAVQQAESSPPPDYPDAELIQDGDTEYYRLPTGQVVAKLSDEERERLKENNVPDPPDDSSAPASPWTPPEETPAGVPGKTYPYPLEDEEESENDFEDFRKVRDILMNHAHRLAANLRPDDPDINRRSLALSRILDRVHQLDDMLPDLNPEQIIRFEFTYNGSVYNVPPWADDDLKYMNKIKDLEKQLAEALNAKETDSSTQPSPADAQQSA